MIPKTLKPSDPIVIRERETEVVCKWLGRTVRVIDTKGAESDVKRYSRLHNRLAKKQRAD